MNKIYKLVWSKVRNCYVAVSELAKSRTKAPKSCVINRTVVAGVLACVLSCGAVMPVMAAGSEFSVVSENRDGSDNVYTFNAGNQISIDSVSNTESQDGYALINEVGNIATVVENNANRISGIYQGDGSLGLYNSSGNVYERDGNFLLFGINHNTVAGLTENLVISENVDFNDVLNYLYERRYDSPVNVANGLEQRFGSGNNFARLLRNYYYQASSMPNGSGQAIRGGTSGFYTDLKEIADALTYDKINRDFTINFVNLDTKNDNNNTIVGTGTVTGTNSIAVGAGHQVSGNNSGAFGDPDIVDGDNSYVVGNNSSVAAGTSDVFVLGNNVSATGTNTVVLGTGSDGSQDNVVSIGSSTNKRRIVNVADGINDSDVATVGQLKSMSGGSSVHGVGVNNITEFSANYNGEGAMGVDSIAIGDAKAAGGASVAIGAGAIATGNNSIAFGTNATATGDGMTREQVNSILSNNKVIRDTLNDARAEYTQSKADYDRQKEIWEGQNEAVARVQHANELIAGYQAEIDNTLRPNAESANNTYNQAKNDYDTLYNDFANRISQIKSIDFSLYTNTSTGIVDRDAIAAALKTQTEEGTTFDYPQSFYRGYVDNYIKVQGDLRNNAIIYEESIVPSVSKFSYNSNYRTFEKLKTQIESGNILRDTNNGLFEFEFYSRSSSDSVLVSSYNALVPENERLNGSTLSPFCHSNQMNLFVNLDLDNGERTYNLNSTVFQVTSEGYLSSKRRVNPLSESSVVDDSEYQSQKDLIEQNYLDDLNYDYGSDSTYTGLVNRVNYAASKGLITTGEAETYSNIIKLTPDFLEYRKNKNLLALEYQHEQYLYEKYRNEGNDSEALIHLGKKEAAKTSYNELSYTSDSSNINITNVSKSISSNVVKNVGDVIVDWFYNDIYVPISDTNAILREVQSSLEGELAEKRQALQEATSAKSAADQALVNKQQQIADTQPTQQDLDDAAAAQASADELAQKKNKLDADLEALNQAKDNLENLENIAGEGESPIAIGNNALVTGKNAIGLGRDSLVTGEDAVGIGRNTVVSGKQSIGIGADNSISKDNAVAIGTNNGITGTNSIAIGNNNVVSGENSIAIGNGLSVTEDNTVALGGKKVSGVIDGTVATDASTIGQTGSTLSVDGKKLLLKNALGTELGSVDLPDSGETYTAGSGLKLEDNAFSVETDGVIATSNTGVLKGGTVYNEVRPDQDGVFVKNANTVGQNLLALDGEVAGVKARMDDAVIYDGVNHAKATLTGGTTGTTLDNVKNGLVSKTSKEAINGGQLWSVKQDIEGFAEDIRRNANSIQTLNGSVSNALASVAAANTLVNTVNDLKADASLNNLSAAGKQVISSAAMDAVQQYMAQKEGNGTNSVDPNTGMSTNYHSVNVSDLIDDLSGNSSAVDGFKQGKNASALATSLKTMNPSDTTTNYVVYDDADATQITLEDSTGEGTKITNLAEGSLSAASTDAVNGAQLYKTNRDIADMQETLSTNNGTVAALQTDTQTLKTNMITLQSQYATTKIQVETGFNVTVDGAKVKTVNPDSAYMDFATGAHTEIVNDNGSVRINVKDDGKIVSGDTGLVTGDTVYEAIKNFDTSSAMEGKANVALDNLTDEGKDVIRDLAKASVNVVGGTNAKVFKTSVEGVDTYTVNVAGTGVVDKDDTGLVTGGTVYDVIQGTVADFDNKLSEYAKKDASNVDAGVWGTKLGTGKVNASDGKLVSGKTVAGETRVANNGNYILKDNSAAQNLSVLDTVLKETRDIAEAVAAGTDANAVHYDGDDKSSITLEGANGTKITNLSDGDVSATSTDAVTGRQLFETNENLVVLDSRVGTVADGNYVSADKSMGENINALDGQLKTVSDGLDTVRTDVAVLRTDVDDLNDKVTGFEVELDGKADTDLGNLTDTGKTVISDIARESVKVKGAGLAKVTSAENGNTTVYTVNVQADGKVEENNTGLVNGGTVYNSINAVRDEFAEDLDGKADLDLSNISDGGKTVIREVMKADLAKKADKADLNKKANVDASNINVDAWAAKLGTGEVAEGNTGLVNGGTVYDAIQRVDRNNNIVEIRDDVIYMGAREGGNVISVYNNEGEGRVITGVITNPEDSTSAANVGYVNAIGDNIVNGMNKEFNRINNKISDVGANAAAMASLTPGGLDGDEKFGVAAAVGNYRNATAGAVGLFYKPQDNIVMNARASFGTNDNMLGAGVYFGLNKGNTPGVTKATLIRAVNAQAAKLTDQDAVIANQNAEISELKYQMAEVMKELAAAKSDACKN